MFILGSVENIYSKYGSWRSLDQQNFTKAESRWWRDLRSICGTNIEGQWFNKGLG